MNYKDEAKKARIKVLEMVWKAQSSHIGSNFSVIDIFTVLFDKVDFTTDHVILSAGWKAASFYYFLAQKGVIPEADLDTYCQEGSKYIGLTEPGIPGVLFAGGSMGMGLPAAVGFALSKKLKKEEGTVYCVMSDGEVAIGTTWEALLIARQHELTNLVILIDQNGFQAMGKTENILFSGDGIENVHVDGHKHEDIAYWLNNAKDRIYSPTVIACKTIKGKGVSFMENDNSWHYRNIPDDLYQKALIELNG
jgi:transketolase